MAESICEMSGEFSCMSLTWLASTSYSCFLANNCAIEIEIAKLTIAIAKALPNKDIDPRNDGTAGAGNLQKKEGTIILQRDYDNHLMVISWLTCN